MGETKVSVILSNFRIEKCVRECMESIVNQTLKEVEIICICDSLMASLTIILEEYAKNDQRIKIVTKQEKNKVISLAQSKYLLFLNAEEAIEPTLIEENYLKGERFFIEAPVIWTRSFIKENNPVGFVEEYNEVYRKLQEWGIYQELEKGYVNTLLSCCAFYLESCRNNLMKMKIIEEILNSDFYKGGLLEHELAYYSNNLDYTLLRSAINAVEWREKRVKTGKKLVRVVKQNVIEFKPKVSVIVPVYNVAEYVGECIESILQQTLKEIELICVNDGSSDNSLDIILEYAEKDTRITVVDQQNCGVSASRNHGVKVSNGECLIFIDSDDKIEKETLEVLYDNLQKKDLDAIYFDATVFYDCISDENKSIFQEQYYIRKHDYSEVYTGIDYSKLLNDNNEYRISPCLQLIRKKLWDDNKLEFYEGIIHEDNLYTFRLLACAKRVSHMGKCFYQRRVHENSIMTKRYTFDHCYGYFVSYVEMKKILDDLHDLSEENYQNLSDVIYRVYSNIKNVYKNLDAEQKRIYYALDSKMYYEFLTLIVRCVNAEDALNQTKERLKKTFDEKAERGLRIKELEKENHELKKNLEEMKKHETKKLKNFFKW